MWHCNASASVKVSEGVCVCALKGGGADGIDALKAYPFVTCFIAIKTKTFVRCTSRAPTNHTPIYCALCASSDDRRSNTFDTMRVLNNRYLSKSDCN